MYQFIFTTKVPLLHLYTKALFRKFTSKAGLIFLYPLTRFMVMNRLQQFLNTQTFGSAADAGLLILRLATGLLMMTHGWPKLISFSEKADQFYDFIGLGGEVSLALTIFAEFFCSLFIVLGLGTRLFLIPLIIVSLVIVLVVHGADPLGDKEHGLLFLAPYITLILTGPGKYSIDFLLQPGRKKMY